LSFISADDDDAKKRVATLLLRKQRTSELLKTKKYSERLTPDNTALLLIHQAGLFTGLRDIPLAELKPNVVALAKAVKVFGVPIIVTATSPEMWGSGHPRANGSVARHFHY
jgi:hypothetical protein